MTPSVPGSRLRVSLAACLPVPRWPCRPPNTRVPPAVALEKEALLESGRQTGWKTPVPHPRMKPQGAQSLSERQDHESINCLRWWIGAESCSMCSDEFTDTCYSSIEA